MATKTIPLTNTQVLALKTLSKYPEGLDRKELSQKVGVSLSLDLLGPATMEVVENHPQSLVALGFVAPQKVEPGVPTVFVLTEKGANHVDRYSARRRNANGEKVPPKQLDRAVLSVRNLKPYGLELFTDDDIREIRGLLSEEYHNVPLAGLRQQIVNRRKVGAYKEVVKLPEWYSEYRKTDEFGEVAKKQLNALGGRCTLNAEHKLPSEGDVFDHVYHRRFNDADGLCVLGRELMKDLIILCPQCFNRQRKFLCAIPAEDPR